MSTPYNRPEPTRRESTYLTFTPRRAIASFDNLVVLANYEEHLREARKIVWRDRGEPAVDIRDIRECLVHGARGGLRAGAIAFAIRSGVNLVLLLARIKNLPRQKRLSLIRHALFGSDSFRAAAILDRKLRGLYRFILNALPVLFPANVSLRENLQKLFASLFSTQDKQYDDDVLDNSPSSTPASSPSPPHRSHVHTPSGDRREARLSSSAQVHQIWVSKKTRRWHSVLAGAIAASLRYPLRNALGGMLCAAAFVRGLQGSYNAYSEKRGFRIPHGDVLVFSLACGQIVYAFLLSPHTLPKAYYRWIEHVAQVPKEVMPTHCSMIRHGTYNLADFTQNASPILSMRHGTPAAPAVPLRSPDRILAVARWTLPIYGALHFVPLLFFKRAAFARAPARMALRAAWGTARSTAFIAVAVVMYQGWFCGMQNAHRALTAFGKDAVPKWMIESVLSRPAHWLGGAVMGLSLFVEAKHRRGELAMYALPKALESAWIALRGRGLVLHTGKYGNPLLTAFAMGMVMNDPQHLSGLVRRVLYQFIGPN
ncbi:hypothetical protein EI94DRAFT_1770597 [Lactarius quietus]|nr:hypothetical protein EI94DRAFT_1770597 [Lactarius quietus]